MQVVGFRPIRMANGSMYLPSVEPLVIYTSNAPYHGSLLMQPSGGVGATIATAATDELSAVVVGFEVYPGVRNLPLRTVAADSNYVDGTLTKATTGDLYTATSDNTTDKQVAVLTMDVSGLVMSGKLDAAAGTTTGSDKAGYFIDIINSYTLDESSASTSKAQLILMAGLSGTSAIDSIEPDGRRVICKVVAQGIGDAA